MTQQSDVPATILYFENKKMEEKIKFLEQRLIKLENHFSGDYQLIASKKIPHRCPICSGKRICTDGNLFWQCESCEGKGIVWG